MNTVELDARKAHTMEELEARIEKAEAEYEKGQYISSPNVHQEINRLLALKSNP